MGEEGGTRSGENGCSENNQEAQLTSTTTRICGGEGECRDCTFKVFVEKYLTFYFYCRVITVRRNQEVADANGW